MRILHGILMVWCLVFPSRVIGEYLDPGAVYVKTDSYENHTKLQLPLGAYKYDIAWQGISVASGDVVVKQRLIEGQKFFRVEANAKTADVIDWVYKLRHHSESLFEANSLKPLSFTTWQKENSHHSIRKVRFLDSGHIESRRWKDGEEGTNQFFATNNLTLDPLSAAFLARSLPIEVSSVHTFDVFNGKNRFLISFRVAGLESLSLGNGTTVRAYRIVPSVEKLTDSSKREPKLDSALIWLSADSHRDILKLESKVWVGSIIAQLIDFTPQSESRTHEARM